MIRSDQYKYVAYAPSDSPAEQLFDMKDDPGETNNLATDPAHADVLARHRDYLRQWCRQTDDAFPHVAQTNGEGQERQ
jgi:arylsulfatase A-like enzyme